MPPDPLASADPPRPVPEFRLAPYLRTLPLFGALKPDSLARVAKTVRERTLAAGERLFDAGQPCQAFYAVRSGAVKLYRLSPDGREQVLHHMTTGRTFAEAAVLHLGHYPVSAAAVAPGTQVLEFDGTRFLRLFRDDQDLAPAMVGSLCGRLHLLLERVEDFTVTSAAARLARHLLRLPARRSDQGLAVELALSKKELASHLAMTPETLSRLLRRWNDEGLVRSERSRIVLAAPHRLLAVADGDGEPR